MEKAVLKIVAGSVDTMIVSIEIWDIVKGDFTLKDKVVSIFFVSYNH